MTTLTIETRRAQSADAESISRVHEAAWRQAYCGMIPHKALDTMVRRRDMSWWARAIRYSTRILVMEIMGEVVGYATLGGNRVATLPQKGEIYELYLTPEYQGVGLGKQLFLAARQELFRIGLTGCVVWVLEDNDPALRFYRNAGGVDIAEGTESFNDTTLRKIAFSFD
ncbi:MAG: GNAT family N-acetyltransferase [Ahrensia sp.]|nr:GNAT family N-acetyltransferase [Ahrensia sp.]